MICPARASLGLWNTSSSQKGGGFVFSGSSAQVAWEDDAGESAFDVEVEK